MHWTFGAGPIVIQSAFSAASDEQWAIVVQGNSALSLCASDLEHSPSLNLSCGLSKPFVFLSVLYLEIYATFHLKTRRRGLLI